MSEKQENQETQNRGEIVVYRSDDGRIRLDVRLQDETVWLTQQLMAELFQTTVPNISVHIRNIYDEGELEPEATVKKFLTVRREGRRQVQRNLDCYNLDMIISGLPREEPHDPGLQGGFSAAPDPRRRRLTPDSTHKKFLWVHREGRRRVQRNLDFYNLDINLRQLEAAAKQLAAETANPNPPDSGPADGHTA